MSLLDIVIFVLLILLNKRIFESAKQQMEQEQPVKQPTQISIMVEEINDIFYAWKDGVDFIGQAKTEQELMEVIANKYPGIMFIGKK